MKRSKSPIIRNAGYLTTKGITGVSWSNGLNYIHYNATGIVEYTEFPAFDFYINKYGIYPSTIQYDVQYETKEFDDKANSLKKKTSLYVEANNERYNDNKKINKFFVCFEDIKSQLVFYILRQNDKIIVREGITTNASIYRVICLFNPLKHDALKIPELSSKIIGLTEVPQIQSDEIGYINILVRNPEGFALEASKIKKPEIDFNLNYNADLKTIHDLITEKISTDKSKGLVLLHGKPGTGKTTYIRYLINILKKKVIFIPPNMVNCLSDPGMMKFLITQQNSVLVIEDAETILMTRNAASTQAVSNVLNLTDGLLSDCINIQIIATFNTDILNIDPALLRKGRLIAKYEFKELESERAHKLAAKLGVSINGSHALTDIYNKESMSFATQKNKIGYN